MREALAIPGRPGVRVIANQFASQPEAELSTTIVHQPQNRQGDRPRRPTTVLARADEVIE
jgi:hypothetical protein